MAREKNNILMKLTSDQTFGLGIHSVCTFEDTVTGIRETSPPIFRSDLSAGDQQIWDDFESMIQTKIDALP